MNMVVTESQIDFIVRMMRGLSFQTVNRISYFLGMVVADSGKDEFALRQ
jgi:hypothetical protein